MKLMEWVRSLTCCSGSSHTTPTLLYRNASDAALQHMLGCSLHHTCECKIVAPLQEKEGSQRVCYAAADNQQFAYVRKLAKDAKLPTYGVKDKVSGDAQTVMAVGPVPAELLGQMTTSLSSLLQAHRLS